MWQLCNGGASIGCVRPDCEAKAGTLPQGGVRCGRLLAAALV
jgi:hypothetical protein